jgi:opacity protein-like surface antigen
MMPSVSRVLPALFLTGALLLFQSSAFGESYVAGQLGVSIPHSLSGIELEGGGFASGTKVTSFDLKNSVMYGAKLGHFFEGTPWLKERFGGKSWLGVETEVFNSTPHIKQQQQTVSEPGFAPTTGETPGSTLRVLTWAMNIVARYPGERWQPYVGIGLGVFFANMNDKSLNLTQSSVSPGLNTQVGVRYIINKRLSTFGEWKFNHTRFSFDEKETAFGTAAGVNGTYNIHHLAFGLAYHF